MKVGRGGLANGFPPSWAPAPADDDATDDAALSDPKGASGVEEGEGEEGCDLGCLLREEDTSVDLEVFCGSDEG